VSNPDLDELNALYRAYCRLPHGRPQIDAIREALKRSEEIGNLSWRLANRYNLIIELAFHGDKGQILPLIAEFTALYEDHPLPKFQISYLYLLYLSLGQWDCLPSLPLAQRERAAEHYFTALSRCRVSPREYHERQYYQCMREGRWEAAEEHYQAALAAGPSPVSPCPACKQSFRVDHAVWRDDWEDVLQQAQPILDGTLKCAQHPRNTFSTLLSFALDRGDRAQADRFAALLQGGPEEEDCDGLMMRYLAFTDPAEGLRILERRLPEKLQLWDWAERRSFFADAWVLCAQCARRWGTVHLLLPEDFPLSGDGGWYATGILADWFYRQALDISLRFDQRNGYPWYQKGLEQVRTGMERMERDG